ncbi:hypothetical protein A3J44_02270 [candidate division WOR-1 bacterium RIFCSPHIGHO2_02_FULL_45_12]|nr:MAG: hypothetical protein A3J44_02270 [candidate division WOR-1 bacterium RIFCSPHIGHO2_02_FULL_45_12]
MSEADIEKYPELVKYEADVLALNLYLPKLRYPYGDVIGYPEAEEMNRKFINIRQAMFKLLNS